LENQTELICRFKLDGTILFVNEAYCRFFGITKSQIEGQKWQPLVWHEDLQMVSDKINSLSPKRPVVTIENRVTAAKGKVRWGQWVNRGFFNKFNQLTEIQTVGRDITERKQYDETLRIAAAAFEAQESILVTDAQKVIQRVNQAFSEMTGFSSKEAIGKTPRILSSGIHDKQFYQRIYESIESKGYWHGELWNQRKNGEIYPVLQTITAVKDEKGVLTHYVGSMVDITVQKQAEKVLLDARTRLEQQVATSLDEVDRFKFETAEINTTLNVLLKHRESDKNDAQTALLNQFEFMVSPLLKSLKGASKGRHQSLRLIKVLETNFEQLLGDFGHAAHLSVTLQKLTPIEKQVAAMVRQGQPTKVIAAVLNVVPGTISVHRKNIRKKLNLNGSSDNLQSYLESLIE
jgi:PAS domain S-box-containing protein